jgi:hypothetical protein
VKGATPTTPPVQGTTTPTVQGSTTPTVKGSTTSNVTPKEQPKSGRTSAPDKVFGKDAKGRTIYEGSRGGHYYINESGKKEYIKKDK